LPTRLFTVEGRVQGVGYRPFVYRVARELGVTGWVQNQVGQVRILAHGDIEALSRLARALVEEAPPLARPVLSASRDVADEAHDEFVIKSSSTDTRPQIHVPPDYFACDDCVRELRDPMDRRYAYPFINCTQCGPRYTLIRTLPYDRPNTTMAGFALCPDCRREYEDPLDRRFHAQPVACPACGPQLEFRGLSDNALYKEEALNAAVTAIHAGGVIAVKGIGGYHLVCDARNDNAVARLRQRKPRPAKPLAIMVPARGEDGVDDAREVVELSATHLSLLTDPIRPIVLCAKREGAALSEWIAPGLNEIGIMLPYSPLHHLLLDELDGPIVATSANISGEPVLTDNAQVEQRLGHVAEGFLHHNRPIQRPADDPVYRLIAEKPRPIRLGRGNAPLELNIPYSLEQPLLAVGGHMKNTIALAWGDRVVISPHIGDLDSPHSLDTFAQVAADLQQLYGISAEALLCDAHPGYASTRWAHKQGLPITQVLHHHAHASAIAGEFASDEATLVFTWDGVGYGEDGSLWGGEAFLGWPGNWQRVATMRPFKLPGGEKAGREPWRSAAALCWETGTDWSGAPAEAALLHEAWSRSLNSPESSAVGRLFDAAAALVGLIDNASFEGQGPMLLEAAAQGPGRPLPLSILHTDEALLECDWQPLLRHLLNDELTVCERAAMFHTTLAHVLLATARTVRRIHGINRVGLSGGVFQNRLLAEQALALLHNADFVPLLGEIIPSNDAGISFGQVIEAAALGSM